MPTSGKTISEDTNGSADSNKDSERGKKRSIVDDIDGSAVLSEEPVAKKPYAPNDHAKYDPKKALSSQWYRNYVTETENSGSRDMKQFKTRFKMLHTDFLALVALARTQEWFPEHERPNARGQPGIPLELFILGAIRHFLGRWDFSDVSDLTGVSGKHHRLFCVAFVNACRAHSHPLSARLPKNYQYEEDSLGESDEDEGDD